MKQDPYYMRIADSKNVENMIREQIVPSAEQGVQVQRRAFTKRHEKRTKTAA